MNTQSTPHILSYKKLATVFCGLLCLTGVTIGASTIDLGSLNIWLTLIIAASKASLVILFFMHMKYEGRVIRLSFISTIFFLAILIGFVFWDVAFR